MSNELKLETFILKLGSSITTTKIDEDAKVNMLKNVKNNILEDSLRVYINNEALFPDDPMFKNEVTNDVEFTAQHFIIWYTNKVCNDSTVKDFINYVFDLKEKTLTLIVDDQSSEFNKNINKAIYNIGCLLGIVGFIGETTTVTVN